MLELFSKGAFELKEPDSALTPLHFSDDVSSLSAILIGDEEVILPPEVRNDMERFISMYEKAPVDLKSLHIVGVSNEQIVERLREIYRDNYIYINNEYED